MGGLETERGGKTGKGKGGLGISQSVSRPKRSAVPECVQAARCRTKTTEVPKIN